MTRAALYCRLSRAARGDKVVTVQVQEANLRKLATRRKLDVVRVFVDDGVSAYSGKARPGFLALLEAIRLREVDVVMAVRMDRFSRRNGETDALLVLCARSGVTLIADGSEIDTDSPMARAMAQIGGVLGELESSIRSERIKAARAESARLGRPHGYRFRPWGYEADQMTLHPAESELVRELVASVTVGESLPNIAKAWHAQGVRTREGGEITPAHLRSILRAPRIAGLRVHRGVVIGPGAWPPLVTPEEQARALAALASRRGLRTTGARRVQLLSGLAICDQCGHRIRSTSYHDGRRSPRYRCSGGPTACGKVSILVSAADTEVERLIVERLRHPETVRNIARERDRAPDTTELVTGIRDLRDQLDALARDFGDGKLDRSEWELVRTGLKRRLSAAESELASLDVAAPEALDAASVVATWDAWDVDRKRTVLARLVGSVEIGKGRVRVNWKA